MKHLSVRSALAVACLLMSAQAAFVGSARADDDDKKPQTERSVYSIFNPTPDRDLRDYNPDRPSKSSSPFTIDAGRVEIETDFALCTHTHGSGSSQNSFQYLDPVLKVGLTSNVDFEFGLNGLDVVRTVRPNGTTREVSGFGDTNYRIKVNLVGNDGGDLVLSVVPYVKIPSNTAASLAIGNNAVEGGGLLTGQLKVPLDFQLGFQTEIDALKGGNDSQRHPNFVNILLLSHEVPGIKNLTAVAEFFSSVSQDRYTPDIYTADFALAYLIAPNTQLDGGVYLGLNKAAPDCQLFAGISHRF